MRSLVFRLSASLFSVMVLLLLLSSLLLSAAPARSSTALATAPAHKDIITDTRWIELIRLGTPGPQLRRSIAALPTFNLHLTDNLMAGRASSSALILISVQRGGSVIVNTIATPYPDGTSYFYAVQFYPPYIPTGGGDGDSTLQPGDIISLSQGGASFTFTVPALTAQVDVATDQVSGAAPISGVVTTYLYRFTDLAGPYTKTATVDAGGNYQADYAGTLDVRPRDNGYVAYATAPNRVTYVRFVAPFLRAQVGGTEISGLAAPRSTVVITVTDAAGAPYSNWGAFTAPDGSFGSSPGYGGTTQLKPGDRIIAASAGQTFSMAVMTIMAQADLANHLVAGATLADQPIEVLRFDGPLCCTSDSFWNEVAAEQAVVTATAAGQYTATLAVIRPNYGAAIVTTPDGNQTYARFAVPYLSARMGSSAWLQYQLTGQVDDASTPVTITLQGPSGYFKDVRSAPAASDGYFVDYGSGGLTLDTGDVITTTTAHGVQAALQLPGLTGQIDPVTDIVSGTAPPNARLTVTVYYYESPVIPPTPTRTPYIITGGGGPPSNPYTVIVTATAQGDYQVNLHGVIDLDNFSIGEVSLTTAEGFGVSRVLSLSRQEGCDYSPGLIYVGGNQVNFWSPAKLCAQYTYGTVRLRDAAGHLKAEQALPVWWLWYGSFSIYFYTSVPTGLQPVAIAVGDSIEVEWTNSSQFVPTPVPVPTYTPAPTPYTVRSIADNQLITMIVPTLTVQLDPVANAISGRAPASTTVALNLYRDKVQLRVYTATVDAQGGYLINLANDVVLEAGDVASVTYTPIGSPAFAAIAVLPMLRAEWYQGVVDGFLPPLSVYTATLKTTPPITVPRKGATANDGYFNLGSISIKPGDSITVTTAQRTLYLSIPYLTAHVDRATATVFGQAPPLARLRIEPYGYYNISQNVTATVNGTYSASFPSLAPLNTTFGKLTYFDAEGNQAISSFATVHWEVVVNDKCFTGIVDAAGLPVTLTLRAASGVLKSTLLLTPTYSYYSACFMLLIQSGDRVALQSASATEVFTVPTLTARHNYALQAVEGAAPPNRNLSADLWWSAGSSRHTYSDSNGHFGLDTSDIRPPLLATGRVLLHDEAGNTTSVNFTVLGYPAYLPIVRR
jgi:hypothetical protein